MKIYIDTKTATWGDADNLVTLELSDEQIWAFDHMSDSEICELGMENR